MGKLGYETNYSSVVMDTEITFGEWQFGSNTLQWMSVDVQAFD